jgi:hypothetical protein
VNLLAERTGTVSRSAKSCPQAPLHFAATFEHRLNMVNCLPTAMDIGDDFG